MSTYLTDKVFYENWHPRQLSAEKAKDYYSKLLPLRRKTITDNEKEDLKNWCDIEGVAP